MDLSEKGGPSLKHYETLGPLASGGMGVVYRARDTRLNRIVALKLLHPEKSGDPKRRQRFLREARAAAALNHPGIVTIYEVGEEGDVDFIAMELVDGHPLSSLVGAGPLPWPRAAGMARQIASALARAHASGIVHRDLKPANVVVTSEDTTKVLDFGIAQVQPTEADATAETATVLTQPGAVAGTLAYMSPEQARGELVDARTDTFSFGVMLYEMLAGLRPFTGTTAVAVFHDIVYNKPKPLPPDVPPAVRNLVERCMEKDREARPSMAEVLDILTGASSPSRQSGTSAPKSRRWWAVAALALFAVAPVAVWTWREFRQSSFAASMSLGDPVVTLCREGWSLLARYDREESPQRAAQAFSKAVALKAENAAAHAGLGAAYAQMYADNPDPQLLRQAESNAVRAVELNPLLADAHVARGRAAYESLRYQDAEAHFRRALELEPGSVNALLGAGASLAGQKRVKDAETAYQRLIAAAPREWRGYHYLGALLYDSGRFEEAVAQFRKADQLAPDNVAVYKVLALAYQMLGRNSEAMATLQRALAVKPKSKIYSNLGALYAYEGRYQDAAQAFERAVSLGANDFANWSNYADALRFLGSRDQSREAYGSAIRLLEDKLRAAPSDSELLAHRALLLAKLGRREEVANAVSALRRSASLDGYSRMVLGVASELAGRRPVALELLREAVQAGVAVKELQDEPDLIALRKDPGYHLRVLSFAPAGTHVR